MIKGLILDVDGTLVLSNDQHTAAWVAAFAAFGYDVPYEQIRSRMGMGGDKLIPAVVPGLSDDAGDGEQIAARRKQLFRERYLAELKPTPGARALLEELRRRGLTLAVASSAEGEELDGLLQAADVADLIETKTTTSDAEESKPAPDIVGVALKRIKLAPDEVLMLGDTPYDIIAAQSLGIGTIAVRCGGFGPADLADAVAVYDDPADLLAHLDASPLMEPVAHEA